MWQIDIENVAGIRSGSATLEAGVNAIQASNWQGKTSLLAAIETVVGTGDRLTDGADRGGVNLDAPAGSFAVELVRRDGRVVRQGDAYLTDERDLACAELFAFLGESNAVRRAVREGENLKDLLTRPLDLENIDEQIGELQDERRQLEAEQEAAEGAARDLPARQERVTQLEEELAELRAERDEVAAVTDDDGGDRRDVLSDKRAARDRTRQHVEDLETQIEELEERLASRREELEALEIPDGPDFERRLAERHDDLQAIESRVELLQAVYNANKRVLDEDEVALLADVERGLMEDELTCWVCGDPAGRNAVTSRLAAIDEKVGDLRQRAREVRDDIDALEAERRQTEEHRQREADLEGRIEDLESRLADRQTARDDARDRLTDLEATVDELETEVAAADERLTDLESEVKYKGAELEDAREDLELTEAQAERREIIEAQLDDVNDELESLRTRKERTKQRVHDEFDAAMQEVLHAFEPGFERAWLDEFDLRIAREGRPTTIDALSEGEVELLGIIAALAGYEAFEVRDCLPVLLLDGLGGLAAEHLHSLVDYLEDRTAYLVTTAYPEVGDFDGHTISPNGWTVVSDEVGATT